MSEKIDNWFTYHESETEDIPKYEAIRRVAKEFAEVIEKNTPPSADQTAAFRKIREAVMTANASIVCKGK
jgi:hypothetical protein